MTRADRLGLLLGVACRLAPVLVRAQGAVPSVSVERAVRAPVVQEVPVTGTVVSPRSSQVSPEVSGRVSTMRVEVGDRVDEGAVLAVLDPELARLDLRRAKAATREAREALADARRRLADAERLSAGNAFAESALLSLRSEVRVDEATLARLEADEARQNALLARHEVRAPFAGAISRKLTNAGLRAEGRIPADVATDISGASDQLEATREALGGNYAVALVIVYLLMVAIFGHWGHPLLIMTTIPLGIAGGMAGLWLLNAVGGLLPYLGLAEVRQPFDMISMLGFLILMGTVVNNPILIVHRDLQGVREDGADPTEAVREAVESRLRPIAMSTVTTVCGLAPLVFLPGEGTELYRGVGAIVLFGLVGTAAVTLTFLPALTVTVLDWLHGRAERIAGPELAGSGSR